MNGIKAKHKKLATALSKFAARQTDDYPAELLRRLIYNENARAFGKENVARGNKDNYYDSDDDERISYGDQDDEEKGADEWGYYQEFQ